MEELQMQEKMNDDVVSDLGDKVGNADASAAARRQMAAYEATLNNPQDYDALQPDTMLVSYDVSCLSPETLTQLSPSDVEWVMSALEEKFLQHVFGILQRKRQMFDVTVDRVVDGVAVAVTPLAKIIDKAKQWGIHELFARLEDRKNALPVSLTAGSLKIVSVNTTPEKKKLKKKKASLSAGGGGSRAIQEPSMLETIVELKDEVTAARILDLMPLTKQVESYWSVYRWMYFVIMLVHIIYMGIFSFTLIGDKPCLPSPAPSNRSIEKGVNQAIQEKTYPVEEYFLFLFYPFIFLAVTIYFEAVQIVARYRRNRIKRGQRVGVLARISGFFANIMDVPYDSLTFFLENLPTIGSFAFAICMLCWYLNYVDSCTANGELNDESSNNAAYLLSACLVIGWLQTITYSRGFESLHSFKNVMKNIVLSDILRFFMVYIFVNIGFSFGFHVLLHLVNSEDEMLKHQSSPLLSVFYNLKLFTNPADIFEISHFEYFTSSAGLFYVRVAFLTYSFVSGLILVNILIAMMNDSYTRVNETERITWRVGSLRQAMAVFRAFPFIMKLKERVSRGSESQTHQTNLAERPSVSDEHYALKIFYLRELSKRF
jgi:hypothetical protein